MKSINLHCNLIAFYTLIVQGNLYKLGIIDVKIRRGLTKPKLY